MNLDLLAQSDPGAWLAKNHDDRIYTALTRRNHTGGEAARAVVAEVEPRAPGFMPLSITPLWGLDFWRGRPFADRYVPAVGLERAILHSMRYGRRGM